MINFVTESEASGWVLRRIALALAEHIPYSKVSTEVDPKAQVNLFFPHYFFKPCPTPSIAFFTHREEETANISDYVAQEANWCLAMCHRTASYLPAKKTSILQVYPDSQFYKDKIVLGVSGRPCPSGRKRLELIDKLKGIPGVEVRFTGGGLPFEALPEFYRDIDYLLVTSDNEGGPLPVLEALAMGKPVIAPDVGFAWNYPVIRYDGTPDDLIDVVNKLVVPRDGWARSAQELMEVIKCV